MPDTTHADNKAVLLETLGEHTAVVRRNAHGCGVALRTFRRCAAGLDDLTHVDGDTRAAQIFWNLHSFVRNFGVEQTVNHLAVTTATARQFFVVLLHLKCLSELVYGCCICA